MNDTVDAIEDTVEAKEQWFKEKMLNQKVLITISDRRVIEGVIQCIDKDMNFILAAATEYYNMEPQADSLVDVDHVVEANKNMKNGSGEEVCGPDLVSKYIGMAMVPGPHVKKVLRCKQPAELDNND